MKKISDEIIASIEILAKLELSLAEKEKAKQDMEQMLTYIEEMNELDTTGIEPMSHVFSVASSHNHFQMQNVFREDIVENEDDREAILANAPEKKNGAFCVPKTIQ